jgi:hypothetical protein
MSLEIIITKLELHRLMTHERKLKRVQELIDKQISELSNQLLENRKLLNELRLIEQLEDLVEYSECYTRTLELVSGQRSQEDIAIIKNIQKMAQDREDRSHEAVELVCNLLDSVRLQKESSTDG